MAASRDLNNQFRMVFESAPNGVMAADAAGWIIQLNAQMERMFGAGLSPQQAAEKLGISVKNVRPTLQRVFTKVGVSRQSELAVLITKLTLR